MERMNRAIMKSLDVLHLVEQVEIAETRSDLRWKLFPQEQQVMLISMCSVLAFPRITDPDPPLRHSPLNVRDVIHKLSRGQFRAALDWPLALLAESLQHFPPETLSKTVVMDIVRIPSRQVLENRRIADTPQIPVLLL
jgi:hypothetical protein